MLWEPVSVASARGQPGGTMQRGSHAAFGFGIGFAVIMTAWRERLTDGACCPDQG